MQLVNVLRCTVGHGDSVSHHCNALVTEMMMIEDDPFHSNCDTYDDNHQVKFYAAWCEHSKAIKSEFEEAATILRQVRHVKAQ